MLKALEHTQNGRGIERTEPKTAELPYGISAHIRALCVISFYSEDVIAVGIARS
jgi:hypothetical protein